MSVIFFSDGNIVLGNKLKSAIDKIGLELTYSNNLAMVLDIVHDSNRAVVFVDKKYSKHVKIVSLMIQSKLLNNVLVVFVDDDKSKYAPYISMLNMSVVPETYLDAQIGTILQCCREQIDGKLSVNMRVVSDTLTRYLSKLGFSPKHSGYRYIKQCIEYAVQNSFDIGKSLYKNTYLFVGKRNNETMAAVERNIRNAITQAYENTHFDIPTFEVLRDSKVTNRMFLSYLVDRISTDKNIFVMDDINRV